MLHPAAHPALSRVPRYPAAPPRSAVHLARNESATGASPRAWRAAVEAIGAGCPDADARELRLALAEEEGLRPEEVVVTSGATEAIQLLVRALPAEELDRAAAALAQAPFAAWVGHCARDAGAELRTLLERCGVPVICTPRGKGLLPEAHPLFLGVTGCGGTSMWSPPWRRSACDGSSSWAASGASSLPAGRRASVHRRASFMSTSTRPPSARPTPRPTPWGSSVTSVV